MIVDKEKFRTFLFTLFSIIFLIVLTILAIQEINKEKKLERTETYTIQSGDNLWQIGSKYRPSNMSIQEYIYNLQEYNNINSTIYPNQEIQILIYEEV